MKPYAVLGVGPAGLMAAHALAMSGKPVSLFSKPDASGNIAKSRLGGAQFLHDPIPGIHNDEEPDTIITYYCVGDADGYRRKVYGSDPSIPFVSMEGRYTGQEQNAWNLIGTYDALWDLLEPHRANAIDVSPQWLDLALQNDWFDGIISTVPAMALCRAHAGMLNEQHEFVSQRIQIANECMASVDNHDSVVYNGDSDYSWYRASHLFGVGSTEYGQDATTPLQTFEVAKPISTNCRCYDNQVMRTGRYGTWTKGVLSHQAFTDTIKMVGGGSAL